MMTDKEIRELLDEITPDNMADVQKGEAEELESLAPGEGLSTDMAWRWERIPGGGQNGREYEPGFASDSEKSFDRAKEAASYSKHAAETRALKRTIMDEALKGDSMALHSPLSVEDKKKIIELKTEGYTRRIHRCEEYVRNTIGECLRSAIPDDLLRCYSKYPGSVAKFPGFHYKPGLLYYAGKDFWVEPDIPLYFQPDDCNDVVGKILTQIGRRVIDKTLEDMVRLIEARSKREVALARCLARCQTYYDLLKRDALMYKTIMDYYENKKDSDMRGPKRPPAK